MRVVIGYESMYGNTHRVAEAVGQGFDPDDEVVVTPVTELTDQLGAADVLIVGAPTHLHGLPRQASRRAALDSADTRYEHHGVDAAANVERGVREWLDELPAALAVGVAAFDTRLHAPEWVTGHPARHIARLLVRRGAERLAPSASFIVDKSEVLRPGELDRAREWGQQICAAARRRAEAAVET